MGLNLRQMICSGAAIAVAVAVYLGLTPLLGHETAGWVPRVFRVDAYSLSLNAYHLFSFCNICCRFSIAANRF